MAFVINEIIMRRTYDPKEFYRAHLARDARFDGKFFVAVKTTGIYCRPICPARKAKLKNLEFFRTAAEATAKGYRPCLRCHPETAPGSADWLGTAALVQRAMRIMDASALEALSVRDIAQKLGVSERWLRTLFQQQVGVNPQSILLTKKLDIARNLLESSASSIVDIAFSSGFQSLRRFNDAFKKQFKQSPSSFRKKGKNQGVFRLQLAYRPPYHTENILHYLKQRAIAGVEQVDEVSYQRLFTYGAVRGWFKVNFEKQKLVVECKTNKTLNILEFVARIKNMFDLDADPLAVAEVLQEDPILAPHLLQYAGLRVPGCWDGFEVAVRAIVGQRISVKAAHRILEKIVGNCGEKQTLNAALSLTHYFPTSDQMLKADLSKVGLPASRVETIKTLAQKIKEKTLLLDGTADDAEVKQKLLSIKGIGPWTAEYIAMRALKHPDAFPETDLELQKRIKHFKVSPEKWTPWRAYAAVLLFAIEIEKVSAA